MGAVEEAFGALGYECGGRDGMREGGGERDRGGRHFFLKGGFVPVGEKGILIEENFDDTFRRRQLGIIFTITTLCLLIRSTNF